MGFPSKRSLFSQNGIVYSLTFTQGTRNVFDTTVGLRGNNTLSDETGRLPSCCRRETRASKEVACDALSNVVALGAADHANDDHHDPPAGCCCCVIASFCLLAAIEEASRLASKIP